MLADDYSQFTISAFPGKYKESEIHLTVEAEGIVEGKEKELRQKLFSSWKFIQKGKLVEHGVHGILKELLQRLLKKVLRLSLRK